MNYFIKRPSFLLCQLSEGAFDAFQGFFIIILQGLFLPGIDGFHDGGFQIFERKASPPRFPRDLMAVCL